MTFISHILGMSSSQLTFIFFRGVGIPPTSSVILMGDMVLSIPGELRPRELRVAHDHMDCSHHDPGNQGNLGKISFTPLKWLILSAKWQVFPGSKWTLEMVECRRWDCFLWADRLET